ncbi:MAG: class I SAM-dependent methyltransferase [Alphaproteobacteria bacterium]|nr:class I SAM-dependent methyltransferase [Alphaproteobacteria bacterium]
MVGEALAERRDVAGRLHALIRRLGPQPLATYMAEALLHPEDGYYRNRDPLGAAGDFITAPEISQMFGELVGLWLATTWQALGRPDPVVLVELGPGRGTLLADALRAARAVPGFQAALRLHLVESSHALRARQRALLGAAVAGWHDRFDDVPDGPLLLVANEFFDALPVHQLVRTDGGWQERLVDSDGDRFTLVTSARPSLLAALVPPELAAAPQGALVEVSPAAIALMATVAGRIAARGGAALVLDYGPGVPALGASLRGVRAHRPADPLQAPGTTDLSADVAFPTLARVAREAGAQAFGPVPQGALLAALGLAQRAERLLARATPAQAEQIRAAAFRLSDPAGMGMAFKALAVLASGAPTPAGFGAGA